MKVGFTQWISDHVKLRVEAARDNGEEKNL
jgi:hypothetical protein